MGQCAQTYLNKLLVPQKRALRLIYFAKPRDHVIPFLLNQTAAFLYNLCSFNNQAMNDVHAKTAPKSLLNKFAKISTKHHYNTRYDLQRNVSVSNSLELKK